MNQTTMVANNETNSRMMSVSKTTHTKGAGCLAGDALFHLIPHAMSPRIAEDYLARGNNVDPHEDALVMWRSVVIAVSIYVFYLMHVAMHSMGGGHSHSHIDGATDQNSHTDISPKNSPINGDKSHLPHMEISPFKSPVSTEKPTPPLKGGNTLVVMVIMGDFIHSLNDGMAIGGAFSRAPSDGLSTSLAVFCHEIPHVVGDFAILVSTGLTSRRSLFLQAFALAPMYAGLIVGVLLGTALNLTDWIFAVSGGMFLFVSLAETMPELFASAAHQREESRGKVLLAQNAGLLAGFGTMLTLAAFEDTIKQYLN
ncbi:zinc transporter ZIP4 isoform X2 [Nematostella vectensis]|uniref:zinc transporter ZIP4 isoform X2 n=1 Tax=Nematostella vectensis TaxID=45351 RepID=UPI00138FA856|nr:zinc transporter ZIP4 isoform X2 [Nematostella vectensis]